MAEHDRDEELSRRYRELAREEPPRALDDAILAAARREVRSHPAPLVAPTGRRRWFVPVAAAAVIVLSAVVTLHVQREQPDMESTAPQYAPPPAARKDEAPAAVAPRAEMREEQVAPKAKKDIDALYSKVEPQKSQPERRQRQAAPAPEPVAPSQAPAGEPSSLARAPVEAKPAEQERFSPDPGRVAAAPAPPPAAAVPQAQPSAPAAQPAPRAADSASTAAGAAPPAAAEDRRAFGGLRDSPRLDQRTLAKREAQVEPPEKMLERIAALRREGREKEADDLYADFKRRYPDYRIPDALREQVLPR